MRKPYQAFKHYLTVSERYRLFLLFCPNKLTLTSSSIDTLGQSVQKVEESEPSYDMPIGCNALN